MGKTKVDEYHRHFGGGAGPAEFCANPQLMVLPSPTRGAGLRHHPSRILHRGVSGRGTMPPTEIVKAPSAAGFHIEIRTGARTQASHPSSSSDDSLSLEEKGVGGFLSCLPACFARRLRRTGEGGRDESLLDERCSTSCHSAHPGAVALFCVFPRPCKPDVRASSATLPVRGEPRVPTSLRRRAVP